MDLMSLRKEVEAIEDEALRAETLRTIDDLENGACFADRGYAEIREQIIRRNAPKPVSRRKLALITALFGVGSYLFVRYGLLQILAAGGYTERSTGRFVTASEAPLSYWFGVSFFGLGFAFLSLMTLFGVLALFTYPVPFLHWLAAHKKKRP